MNYVNTFTAAGLLLILNTLSAYAAPIIWINDSQGQLGTVDITTGSATVIGNSGVGIGPYGPGLYDIAFDPSGNLYGVNATEFYSVNKNTGVATPIGSLNYSDIVGLTFSSTGILYASGLLGELYTVNTTTGAAKELFNTGFTAGGDLAFNTSILYDTDGYNLISINLANDTASKIGAIVGGGDGNFLGLASINGKLYGVDDNSIYSVNTSTGHGTLVSTYGNGLGTVYGATSYFVTVPSPTISWLLISALPGFIGFSLRKTIQR